jgi:hypothetical protein
LVAFAEFGGVAETEAFEAAGNHDEIFYLAYAPV